MPKRQIKVLPPTVKQAGDPRKKATWTLLPVAPGEAIHDSEGELPPVIVSRCSQCAIAHEPDEPHDVQSLRYQYAFFAEHNRWPNWGDAIAHCTPEVQMLWREALKQRGVSDEELVIPASSTHSEEES